MGDVGQTLNEAYRLIEQGETHVARRLLDDIHDEGFDNPDYWWIYAHAVDNREDGQAALDRVLDLDPDYPGAQKLVADLEDTTSMRPLRSLKSLGSTVPSPPTLPDMPAAETDDFTDIAEDDTEEPQSRRSIIFFVAALIIILVILAILLIMNNMAGAPPEPTEVADAPIIVTDEPADIVFPLPTEEPTADDDAGDTATDEPLAEETLAPTDEPEDIEPLATQEPDEESLPEETPVVEDEDTTDAPLIPGVGDEDLMTPPTIGDDVDQPQDTPTLVEAVDAQTETETAEPSPDDEEDHTEAFLSSLSAVALADDDDGAVEYQTTELGETIIINICSEPGPEASSAIAQVLNIVSENLDTLPVEIMAVGVGVQNCEEQRLLRVIAVERQQLNAFASGDVDYRDLLAQLRPID